MCPSNYGRQRVELLGAADFIDRLLLPATKVAEFPGEPLMGGGVAGIQLKGFSEFGFAAREIPTISILLAARDAWGRASVGSSSKAFSAAAFDLG